MKVCKLFGETLSKSGVSTADVRLTKVTVNQITEPDSTTSVFWIHSSDAFLLFLTSFLFLRFQRQLFRFDQVQGKLNFKTSIMFRTIRTNQGELNASYHYFNSPKHLVMTQVFPSGVCKQNNQNSILLNDPSFLFRCLQTRKLGHLLPSAANQNASNSVRNSL